MSLDITTKTKPTIKPISISFNTLKLNEVDSIALLESQSSDHPWSKNQLSESIKNQNNVAYSLSLDGQIIGFVIAMPTVDTADILNIVINPKYQKKGYGKSLFIYLIKELKYRGIKDILLEVRESNIQAIKFYLRLGFKKISVRKNYYMENSNQLSERDDGIIMRLEI